MTINGRNSILTGNSLRSAVESLNGFYVNVNNADAFLISYIYSVASILFICLIGTLTAFNTLTFTEQVQFPTKGLFAGRKRYQVCPWINILPLLIGILPYLLFIVEHCHKYSTNYSLSNRVDLRIKSACYCFLCLTLFVGFAFLISMLILNYESYIIPAVEVILNWVLNNDNKFCQKLEPQLHCKMNLDVLKDRKLLMNQNITQSDDAIAWNCGQTRRWVCLSYKL